MANNLKLINTNTINSKPIRNYIKVKNTGGPKGDTGATGATGPQGPQGPAGQAATINIGETTTLLPGQTATVTNTGTQQNATLNFGIPQGLRGPTGAQGPKGDTGPQGLKGDKGNDGAAATIQVNATNTGEPGTNAQVTNIGNEHFAQLNFTIPRGATGATGAQGPQGPQGQKGDKGDTGSAATVTVGSTTTTSPGTSATVTNSGTTSAAVLNFGIPSGAPGKVKSEVVAELPDTGEDDTFYLVNREAITQTVTGKTINFTNSENAGDITDAQIDGETSQQTYTGKNIFNLATPDSNNGVTVTANADGSFTLNGKTTGVAIFNFILPALKPAGTYTISCTSKNQIMDDGFFIRARNQDMGMLVPGSENGPSQIRGTGTNYVEKTFISTDPMYCLALNLTTIGVTYNNMIIYPQVEASSSATSWERYVGGKASPNPDYPQAVRTVTGENVVKICGKNLINLSEFVKGRLDNGVIGYAGNTTDMTIGTDQISFTTNLYYRGIVSGLISVSPSTTYSYSMSSTSTGIAVFADAYDHNGKWIDRFQDTTSFTTQNNCYYVRVSYQLAQAGTYVLTNPQLELGSTASTYEAYKSQSYEVNFDLVHGKNMLDPSTLVDGYISVNGEYNAAHTNGEMRSGMIAVSPSTAYTFSIQATSSTYDPWFGVGEYTADNVASFVKRNTNSGSGVTSITFTTSATTNYISVSARNLKAATKVQLEQSNSATTYEPWSPLELCKIGDYQDYIWNDNGTWKKHKAIDKVILNGSETWHFLNDGGTFKRYYTDSYSSSVQGLPETTGGLSDHFGYAGVVSGADVVGKIYFNKSSGTNYANGNITVTISGLASTADAIDAWMTSNSTTFYYTLANPTDETITNATLIAQLDALAAASLYSGENNITTITPNELPTLELDYVTYDKYNQNKVYIWNDDLEQWQIIVQ